MNQATLAPARTKSIPFEAIKANVMKLVVADLRAAKYLGSAVYAKGADGSHGFYDVKMALAVLLPTLKQAVEENTSHTQVLKQALDELTARCAKVVNDWDVRQVNRLVDLFPGAVPANCNLRKARCEDDEQGEWVVTFDLDSHRAKSTTPSDDEKSSFAYLVGGAPDRLKNMLPQIKAAQAEYNAAWAASMAITFPASHVATTEGVYAATAEFNKVLERAAYAFYMDTRAYNHWSTIKQVWAPDRHGSDPVALWFVQDFEAAKVAEKLEKMAEDISAGVTDIVVLTDPGEVAPAVRERGG